MSRLGRSAVITGALASILVVGVGLPASHARTMPRDAATIGFVFSGGIDTTGGGVTAYRQSADGALTHLSSIAAGGGVHSLALVHLKGGRIAIYDLVGTGRHAIYGFYANAKTGALTTMTPAAQALPDLGDTTISAYDPLAKGLPGTPIIVLTRCATTAADCLLQFAYYEVDPVTGALGNELSGGLNAGAKSGPADNVSTDGTGGFAAGVSFWNGAGGLLMTKVTVAGGKTGLGTAVFRALTDNAVGQNPVPQAVLSPVVVTSAHMVEFAAGPTPSLGANALSWNSYALGSPDAKAQEALINYEVSSAYEANRGVFLGEYGRPYTDATQPALTRLERFGTNILGVGGVFSSIPNATPLTNGVAAMFEQNEFFYVGMSSGASLGYSDAGTTNLTPTKQSTWGQAHNVVAWTGFPAGAAAVPTAPLAVKAAYPKAGKAVVSWKAPKSAGGAPVTEYFVRWSPNLVKWPAWATTKTALIYPHSGWRKGITEHVQVVAANWYGKGAVANLVVKPTK